MLANREGETVLQNKGVDCSLCKEIGLYVSIARIAFYVQLARQPKSVVHAGESEKSEGPVANESHARYS